MTLGRFLGVGAALAVAVVLLVGFLGRASMVEEIPQSVKSELQDQRAADLPDAWRPAVQKRSEGVGITARNLPPCTSRNATGIAVDDEVDDFAWSVTRDGDRVTARQITVYSSDETAEKWFGGFPQDTWGCVEIDGRHVTLQAVTSERPATPLDDIGDASLSQTEVVDLAWAVSGHDGAGSGGAAAAVAARSDNVVTLVVVYDPGLPQTTTTRKNKAWRDYAFSQVRPTVEEMARFTD